ncbi:MAG: hypothetical protein K8T26_01655 [Lentisphaerae bacterium]|nr:hypothetical protein [Lentisphaerota bacterium]
MKFPKNAVGALAAVCLLSRGLPAGDLAPEPRVGTHTGPVHVAEFTLTDTRTERWGPHVLPAAAFTNTENDVLGREEEAVEIHREKSSASTLRVPPDVLEYLARTGKDILVDTSEGPSVEGDAIADENIQTITLKTSYLRLFEGKRSPYDSIEKRLAEEISVGSTFDIDTERGTYELREVGLGLWGDRLWLVRGLPVDEDDSGSIGVQFKKEW